MKITIEPSNDEQKVSASIDTQPYGLCEFWWRDKWNVGVICYLSEGRKQLVLLSDPESNWANTKFPFRSINTKIIIES